MNLWLGPQSLKIKEQKKENDEKWKNSGKLAKFGPRKLKTKFWKAKLDFVWETMEIKTPIWVINAETGTKKKSYSNKH